MTFVLRQLRAWLAVFVLCLPTLALASADKFFDAFLGDLPAELSGAASAGKKGVLLVFHVDDCSFCERMREQIFARPEVQDYYRRHFVIIQIDVNGSVPIIDPSGRETIEKNYARELRIVGTPTLVYLDTQGKEMHRFSGVVRDVGEFLARGRYVVGNHWQKKSFEQYRATVKKR